MVGGMLPNSAAPSLDGQGAAPAVHLLYPQEGLGAIYRRTMLNDLLSELIDRTRIRQVAELPLDTYGLVGAGSLILAQRGCQVALISGDPSVLSRAQALMAFNGLPAVRLIQAPPAQTGLPDNAFDFAWSFDRVQALADPAAFLAEMCRVAKSAMVIVPNAYNYGQYAHYIYHRLSRTRCEFVAPRGWMRRAPLRAALQRGGMAIVRDGIIDAPWWPGFPELPNLVRGLLGRPPVSVRGDEAPESSPRVLDAEQARAFRAKVAQASFIERGRWPGPVKLLFSHNVYVLACKPQFSQELGLGPDLYR